MYYSLTMKGILAAIFLLQVAKVLTWDTPRFTTPGEFPHQISMLWSLPPDIPLVHSCSGAIINSFWVLTSGYCIANVPNLGIVKIKAGSFNITLDDDKVQIKEIDKMFVHEKYPGANTLRNLGLFDVGMIKVKTAFDFNKRVQPILLEKSFTWLTRNKLSYNLVFSGWGSLTYGVLPEHPDIMRTVNLPIIPDKVCEDNIKTIFPQFKLSSTQLCTRPVDGSLAACIGDFGGPIIQKEPGQVPILVGIHSWSSSACNTNGLPPVFLRVGAFTKWVETKLKENHYVPTS